MGQLVGNNIEVEHESSDNDANVVVVNTCGFIDNAKEESINTILTQAKFKESGKIEYQNLQIKLGRQISDDIKHSIKIQ